MDESEKKVIEDIEEYGCHIVHVFEEGDYPRFTYSIGIEKKTKQPDIIITGLKRELAHWVINEYNRRVKAGEKFEINKFYSEFLDGFDITFRPVAKKNYGNYLGWAIWYYAGEDFNVFQLVFPSTKGIWPWDKEASEDFKWFQPLLNAN